MVDGIYDQKNTELDVDKLCGGFPRGYLLRCCRKYCFSVINTKGEEFLIFATDCARLSSQRGQKALPQRGKFFGFYSGVLLLVKHACLFSLVIIYIPPDLFVYHFLFAYVL